MNNILVPIDLSEISSTIVIRAACLAKYCSSKVWLLHVVLPSHETIPFNIDRKTLRSEIAKGLVYQRHQLHDLADQFRELGVPVLSYHVAGNTGKVILNEAKRVDADLIIMGTHGHGNVYHAIFGGTGQKIMRTASCPVMLVSKRETKPCAYWKQKVLNLVNNNTLTAGLHFNQAGTESLKRSQHRKE